jgi:hypothetical protein
MMFIVGQVWSFTPVIPALGRLRQEDPRFRISLAYIVSLSFKKRERRKGRKEEWREERERGGEGGVGRREDVK